MMKSRNFGSGIPTETSISYASLIAQVRILSGFPFFPGTFGFVGEYRKLMKANRKKILLTGATGNMGLEGLKLLAEQGDRFELVVFALPTKKDKKILSAYENLENVSIVWGDLTSYSDVKAAVAGVDKIIHVGALVSPMADHQPELAWKINFEGTKNIVDALLERDDFQQVKLIYVGTVAETGNRPTPYHWGRIGDPLVPSVFDYYALSKIAAERYVIESGLKYWVSLRQTGIMHENILDVNDGIGYHMPLDNHLEWITARDSGQVMLNSCSENLPEDFWGRVYNIGGGESCRLTGYDFLQKMYGMMGVDFHRISEPNWFATRNFHGQYYYDSDLLENYLHFRSETVDDVLKQIKKKLPFSMRLLKYLPKKWLREKVLKFQAMKGDTPLNWMESNNEEKIKAFFGSREQWEGLPGWENFNMDENRPHQKLDHGYDEQKLSEDLELEDMQKTAAFRGGKCLSTLMEKGELRDKLKWECAHGHSFEASPYLILKTGHWCSECLEIPWNFDQQAHSNPFLAQVWHADHPKDETQFTAP